MKRTVKIIMAVVFLFSSGALYANGFYTLLGSWKVFDRTLTFYPNGMVLVEGMFGLEKSVCSFAIEGKYLVFKHDDIVVFCEIVNLEREELVVMCGSDVQKFSRPWNFEDNVKKLKALMRL